MTVTGHGPYNIFKAERLHEAAGTALPGSSRQALGEVLLAAWHRLPEQERGTYREAYAARRREVAAAAASRVSACQQTGLVQVRKVMSLLGLGAWYWAVSSIDKVIGLRQPR